MATPGRGECAPGFVKRTVDDMTNHFDIDAARAAALESFLSTMDKDRPGEVRTLDDNSALDVEVIPTGAISLDVALGVGGLPKGRIVELYGPTGGGKTTLALEVAANCQRLGGVVGFVDAEHALSRELALNIGIDPARFVVHQPNDGEQAIDMVEAMLTSGAFDMVIVDSVAAMTPRAEIEADIDTHGMALHARLMSKFMRRVVAPVERSNALLVLINQVRTNLGSYGAPETSTGGAGIKFFSSVRIEVRTSNSKRIGRDGAFTGTTVTAKVVKNKLASPFRIAEYDIVFGQGISGGGALLGVAEQLGLVTRAGASYTDVASGERIAVGKDAAKARLDADDELRERLTQGVYAALRGDSPEAPESTDAADMADVDNASAA
jgi:recombination protein RecA